MEAKPEDVNMYSVGFRILTDHAQKLPGILGKVACICGVDFPRGDLEFLGLEGSNFFLLADDSDSKPIAQRKHQNAVLNPVFEGISLSIHVEVSSSGCSPPCSCTYRISKQSFRGFDCLTRLIAQFSQDRIRLQRAHIHIDARILASLFLFLCFLYSSIPNQNLNHNLTWVSLSHARKI